MRVPNWYQGGDNSIQQVVPLGTSSVASANKILGSVPKNCRVTGVRVYGQAGVTATGLTLDVYARTSAGGDGSSLLASAIDIAFASAAAAKAGTAGTLSATASALRPDENQLLEMVITATACSAGPGDVLVEVAFESRL